MTRRRIPRRFAWLMVLAGLLLGRGLMPEGWMPVASAAGGVQFTLCPGAEPVHVMVMTADGKMHHKAPGKGQAGSRPCAFAWVGTADAPPPVPPVITPARFDVATPLPVRIGPAPGRGLAAPPPPATGPPILA